MGFTENEFNRIVDLYSDSVFRLAMIKTKNKSDAEDVFQDTFIKLFKCKLEFESDEHIKRWLMKVTVSTSIDLLKSFWQRCTTGMDEDVSFYDETDKYVWDEIKKIPEKYRIPIHLYYFEGYSTDEIAVMTDEKPTTIRTRISRAKKMLNERMGDSYEWI